MRRPGKKPKIKFLSVKIIYEDSDLVVVDKPAGLLSVPVTGSTVPNALALTNKILSRKHERAFIVHRIDRYTSGLLLFAKHRKSRQHLVEQFREHTPTRRYLAIVRGTPKRPEGKLVHHMVLRDSGFRQEIVPASVRGAAKAELSYRVLETGAGVSLLEIELHTGLKNQIRVQCGAAGFPIVGDRHYHDEEHRAPIDHQALHAAFLGFIHPRTQREVSFESRLPRELEALL
jgi:23S rRNA pseudouridine1911/1915/1917 synthase